MHVWRVCVRCLLVGVLLLLSLVVQSALASITAHHSGISLHVE